MTDERERSKAIYESARFTGIPAADIDRFLGTMKACGYELETARPEALHKRVCCGIFNSAGKMHVSENCISDVSAVLDDELYYLQQHEPDDGWHIASMFIETTPSPLAEKRGG